MELIKVKSIHIQIKIKTELYKSTEKVIKRQFNLAVWSFHQEITGEPLLCFGVQMSHSKWGHGQRVLLDWICAYDLDVTH